MQKTGPNTFDVTCSGWWPTAWSLFAQTPSFSKCLRCSFYLYRFRKYMPYGFPIIHFCNPGVHYETPCISVSPTKESVHVLKNGEISFGFKYILIFFPPFLCFKYYFTKNPWFQTLLAKVTIELGTVSEPDGILQSVVTRLWTGRPSKPGLITGRNERVFSKQPRRPMVPAENHILFPRGIKRQGREADHSPRVTTEVKNR